MFLKDSFILERKIGRRPAIFCGRLWKRPILKLGNDDFKARKILRAYGMIDFGLSNPNTYNFLVFGIENLNKIFERVHFITNQSF